MIEKRVAVDFTYARTPLFVRQMLASAFGVPLGQEFTWDSLGALIRDAARASQPEHMTVSGLSNLAVNLPEEAAQFKGLLRDIKIWLPSLDIRVVLHD